MEPLWKLVVGVLVFMAYVFLTGIAFGLMALRHRWAPPVMAFYFVITWALMLSGEARRIYRVMLVLFAGLFLLTLYLTLTGRI